MKLFIGEELQCKMEHGKVHDIYSTWLQLVLLDQNFFCAGRYRLQHKCLYLQAIIPCMEEGLAMLD